MNPLVSHRAQWGLPVPAQGTSEPLQQQSVMNPLVSHQAQWRLPAPGTSEPLQQQSVMNPLVSHQAQWRLPAPGTSEPLQQQSVMNPLVSHQAQEGLLAPETSLQQSSLGFSEQPVLSAPQRFTSFSSASAPSSIPINQQHEANPIVETPSQVEILAQHQQFANLTPQQCQQQLPDQQALCALSQLYGRSGLHPHLRQTNMETEGQPIVIVQNIGISQLEIHQNGDRELMAVAPPANVHVLQRYLPLKTKANMDRIFKIPRVWEVIVRELRLGNDCCPKEPVEFVFCHLQSSFQLLIWLLKKIGEAVTGIVEPSEIEVMIDEVRKARVHEVECQNLRKHLSYIVNGGVDIRKLVDYLFSKSIINDSDMEKIKCQQTSSEKCSLLLHKVLKCTLDKDPVEHLRQWFVDEDRQDLADLLAVKPEDVQESYHPEEA
ncbi:uncharacterized protein LOC106162202 [Lingula anatina]|uniref:Uncharacterized protein LOC106162202 n=1 Tax=Lingula anatina TaxID=7574 RepID=A0A1S3I9A8_LINAN|nr:uncharacterized protein LOC106162202 [Lingula anatina]|eukprot:XP_013394837.1 uncharacterized protein LOC106162202 [Lingula anatina]